MSHILVADDDPDVRELMALSLTAAGHRVEEVATGTAALGAMRTGGHDGVVLDDHMPGMDGTDVLEHCSAQWDEQHPGPVVVMVSAINERRRVRRAMASGCSEFLLKPFPMQHLVERLDVALTAAPAAPGAPGA